MIKTTFIVGNEIMFKELNAMITLLQQVLKELNTINETQKQLLTAIDRNSAHTQSLLSVMEKVHDKVGGSGEKRYPDRLGGCLLTSTAAAIPVYQGNGGSSHKGSAQTKSEESSSDCRSKCNGKCDDNDPTCA